VQGDTSKRSSRFPELTLRLPAWVQDCPELATPEYPQPEDRMRLVIALARRNVQERTGGPFGAAVFDMRTNRLVAPGVNLVVPLNCSIAHAEVVALALAQQLAARYDLGATQELAYELVCSTEPCSMCLGAIPWSGVRSILCGAREEDARKVGFDEGPKAPRWYTELEARGIRVVRDLLRAEAADVLQQYADDGGEIYNGRQANAR